MYKSRNFEFSSLHVNFNLFSWHTERSVLLLAFFSKEEEDEKEEMEIVTRQSHHLTNDGW